MDCDFLSCALQPARRAGKNTGRESAAAARNPSGNRKIENDVFAFTLAGFTIVKTGLPVNILETSSLQAPSGVLARIHVPALRHGACIRHSHQKLESPGT